MNEPQLLSSDEPASAEAIAVAPARVFGLPRIAWVGLLLAVLTQGICYGIVGTNAGLLFGGVVFAALMIPPLCLAEEKFVDRMLVTWVINDGIGLVWMIPIFQSSLTVGQWFRSYVVLFAWSAVPLGIVCVLRRMARRTHLAPGEHTGGDSADPRCVQWGLHGGAIVASAITVALALLWLASPILLARGMPEHPNLAHRMVSVHPLMAVNSVVKELGLWTERPIAYRHLLTLGQDLPAGLPSSILPATLFHLLVGAVALALSRVPGRR